MSGYFSPKRAIAPSVRASAMGIKRPAHGRAGHHQRVDGFLDLVEPLLADCLGVGEVEPQAVGLDFRPGLLGMLAQMPVQGVVQHVGRRVSATDRLPPAGIDRGFRLLAQAHGSLGNPAQVEDEVVVALGVFNLEDEPGTLDRAGVSDLAARLGVERGPVENQGNGRAGLGGHGRFGELALLENADHGRVGLGGRVSQEFRPVVVGFLRGVERAGGEDVGGLGGSSRDGGELDAGGLEAGHIDAQVLVGGQALGHLDGNAVG